MVSIKKTVKKLTLDEKISLLTGFNSWYSNKIPRLKSAELTNKNTLNTYCIVPIRGSDITVENFKYNLIKPTEEVKDSIVNDVNIR